MLTAGITKNRNLVIHTYIHTYIHAYIHTYIHAYIHTCIHTYIHTYMHTFYRFDLSSLAKRRAVVLPVTGCPVYFQTAGLQNFGQYLRNSQVLPHELVIRNLPINS